MGARGKIGGSVNVAATRLDPPAGPGNRRHRRMTYMGVSEPRGGAPPGAPGVPGRAGRPGPDVRARRVLAGPAAAVPGPDDQQPRPVEQRGACTWTSRGPGWPTTAWDLVVIDPPHVADAGAASIMGSRYGTVKGIAALRELIEAGIREAWRVSSVGILVKVADHAHQGEHLALSDWVKEAVPVPAVHGAPHVPPDLPAGREASGCPRTSEQRRDVPGIQADRPSPRRLRPLVRAPAGERRHCGMSGPPIAEVRVVARPEVHPDAVKIEVACGVSTTDVTHVPGDGLDMDTPALITMAVFEHQERCGSCDTTRAQRAGRPGVQGLHRTRPRRRGAASAPARGGQREELMLKCQIIGNLGNDPEMRYSAGGAPFLRFNVASNYRARNARGRVAGQDRVGPRHRLRAAGRDARAVPAARARGCTSRADSKRGRGRTARATSTPDSK